AIARPVDRIAESALLPRDRVARLFFPLPHALHECLAPDVATVFALGIELAFDDHLRRDAGVVRAWLPERIAPVHAMKARQRIHERVLKRMTHVQRPRHVRRRDHDAVGLALAGWCEPAVRLPSFV